MKALFSANHFKWNMVFLTCLIKACKLYQQWTFLKADQRPQNLLMLYNIAVKETSCSEYLYGKVNVHKFYER